MKRFLTFFLSSALATGLLMAQSSAAQSLQEIQEYCQSMNGEGINDEDARAYIEECINEQKSYLDQDSYSTQENYDAQEYTEQESVPQEEPSDYQNDSYSEESTHYQEQQYEQDSYTPDNEYQEQNCYTKVDEQIQKLLDNDPNAPFDYDQMLEQCSKGNF